VAGAVTWTHLAIGSLAKRHCQRDGDGEDHVNERERGAARKRTAARPDADRRLTASTAGASRCAANIESSSRTLPPSITAASFSSPRSLP
jgi:hypothetical protein